MDKLYLVIPAYKEEATIAEVVEEWYPMVVMAGPESRLLIIDDGSRDSTWEVLKKAKENRPQMIIKHKANSGHGPTILKGYRYAVGQGADYVFQTDSDGQTRANEFPEFWRCRRHYDMVLGKRNHRQDGLFRIVVTNVLKAVVFICFHIWVGDANTPFRLMEGESLKKELSYVPKDFFLTNVLLSVAYTKHKRNIRYIPITFRPRQGGINSINVKRIFNIGKNAIFDFVRLNKRL